MRQGQRWGGDKTGIRAGMDGEEEGFGVGVRPESICLGEAGAG